MILDSIQLEFFSFLYKTSWLSYLFLEKVEELLVHFYNMDQNIDLNNYVSMLDAIISVSDPDKVSPKKIRKALEQLFSVSLENKKKEVNELIVARFQILQADPHILVSNEEFQNLKMIRGNYDALLSSKSMEKKHKLTESSKKTRIQVKKKKSKKSSKDGEKKVANPNSNAINSMKLRLSDDLYKFLGERELPRTQVVKQVWDYIKEHNLQSPEDRREIICDDRMRPIFGDKMTMFALNKILSKHLTKIEPKSEEADNSRLSVKLEDCTQA